MMKCGAGAHAKAPSAFFLRNESKSVISQEKITVFFFHRNKHYRVVSGYVLLLFTSACSLTDKTPGDLFQETSYMFLDLLQVVFRGKQEMSFNERLKWLTSSWRWISPCTLYIEKHLPYKFSFINSWANWRPSSDSSVIMATVKDRKCLYFSGGEHIVPRVLYKQNLQ